MGRKSAAISQTKNALGQAQSPNLVQSSSTKKSNSLQKQAQILHTTKTKTQSQINHVEIAHKTLQFLENLDFKKLRIEHEFKDKSNLKVQGQNYDLLNTRWPDHEAPEFLKWWLTPEDAGILMKEEERMKEFEQVNAGADAADLSETWDSGKSSKSSVKFETSQGKSTAKLARNVSNSNMMLKKLMQKPPFTILTNKFGDIIFKSMKINQAKLEEIQAYAERLGKILRALDLILRNFYFRVMLQNFSFLGRKLHKHQPTKPAI